jgi:hypothetical protein
MKPSGRCSAFSGNSNHPTPDAMTEFWVMKRHLNLVDFSSAVTEILEESKHLPERWNADY